MTGERGMSYAEAVMRQGKNWRERALAAHPRDREMSEAFDTGLAMLLLERLMEIEPVDGQGIEHAWAKLAQRAFDELFPESEAAASLSQGQEDAAAGSSPLGKGATTES